MTLDKTYSPHEIESHWYQKWMEKKFFHSVPDQRKPYTIVIPPPNVTGVLHMGHMLNNTIQDILIRRARMKGFNACWVPGTDHASIATEAKVVGMLKEKGIKKTDITRDEFLKYAWEWTDKYGGIILEQLKKLGASCDWDRTRFTNEPKLSNAVIDVFIDLHKKGLIYRGQRMTNWDPQAKTALSDEEVNFQDVNSKLYHIRYQLENSNDFITIATTRPETILGDTAICVHPDDDRYKNLIGKRAMVPLINRAIPIIADEYVDREFGTGALKVTPAHDKADYELGLKHSLLVIDIFNEDATLNENAQLLIGEDRFKARSKISKMLEETECLVKVEDYKSQIGYSERTNIPIEPRLTTQWFLKMMELSKPALENVMNDNIRFFPTRFKNVHKHWMENIRDWCISRQLWWGQRIPAWYDDAGNVYVAKTIEEANQQYLTTHNSQPTTPLHQDEDVVDTWFSSWLWPISVFDGFENKEELKYYYPTTVLVTGHDIIFFWVARMIIAGYEYEKEKPFEDVYFTGMVRDQKRRKMSKSLGNSPEPLELIEKFSADGVRVGMLLSSAAGNDLLFDEKLCEQGRNFANKIWNALRLVKGWEIKEGDHTGNHAAIHWFEAKMNQTIADLEKLYENYQLSEALKILYSFVWDDFCAWYLEMIKPGFEEPIDAATYEKTIMFFEKIAQLLHPIMPFITEEIWHQLKERGENDFVIISKYPEAEKANTKILEEGQLTIEVITNIREIRAKAQLKNAQKVKMYFLSDEKKLLQSFYPVIMKCAGCESIEATTTEPANTNSFVLKEGKFFVDAGVEMDKSAEREKLIKEIEYTKGFIESVEKKLANEKFVANANPVVLEKERMKLADGEAKVKALEESLEKL